MGFISGGRVGRVKMNILCRDARVYCRITVELAGSLVGVVEYAAVAGTRTERDDKRCAGVVGLGNANADLRVCRFVGVGVRPFTVFVGRLYAHHIGIADRAVLFVMGDDKLAVRLGHIERVVSLR